MKIAIVSGGFDPIHSGHVSYLKEAATIGEKLIVLLNSDAWLKSKKGKFFLPFSERQIILESLSMVDEVLGFDDDELGSCINGLQKIKKLYPNDELIFCNGGDRNKLNIPEMSVENINFKFSIGGDDKKNSSSWILKSWQYSEEDRIWGKFYNLFEDPSVKVKELIVYPEHGMSFQRHFHRDELWLVSQGSCVIYFSPDEAKNKKEIYLNQYDYFHVPKQAWHQITNPYKEICKIIEIQYGDKTIEDDIERLHFYRE